MQFTAYISDTPVTLKQGHQTYTDNLDPKQDYNHAKFERSCLNGIWEKQMLKFFFSNEEIHMSIISLEHVWKLNLLDIINNQAKFQLAEIGTNFFHLKLWHDCALEIQPRSLKMVRIVKLNEYYHDAKFDIYHNLQYLRKSQS